MNGALQHIKVCQEVGVIPINGIETYWRPDRRVQGQADWRFRRWHLILLAQNLVGWHNLLRISSEAFSTGFYQSPCVDDELLEKYNEGLICTTACMLGPLCFLIENGTDAQANDWLGKIASIFKDRLYISIMPHDWDRQQAMNLQLVSMASRWGLPVIAEGDAHYPYSDWAETQKILTLISTNTTIANAEKKNRERLARGDEIYELGHEGLHLMSHEEIRDRFIKYHPNLGVQMIDEAINNTHLVATSIEPFLMDRSVKMPKLTKTVEEAEEMVTRWCREGLQRIRKIVPDEIYEEHLQYELYILREKSVFDYFILIGDIVRWAKSTDPLPATPEDPYPTPKRSMRVGSGRGSAAGSLVSYLCGITAIDPIGHKLKFGRFLNLERKGLPDIDIDFPSDERNLVKEYVARKYGRDHVADVMAARRFQPRAAIKDVSRIMGGDFRRTKEITDLIDPVHDTNLEEIRATIPELDAYAQEYPAIWKHAVRLENAGDPLVSGISRHAAGVVITPGPIAEYMATIRADENEVGSRTAWAETPRLSIVDDFGFVKADFLSITGMQQQQMILDSIQSRTGELIDLDALPICQNPYEVDPKVMECFQLGLTLGINQFEGENLTAFLKKCQPENVVDLAAINALYHPGPIGGGGHNKYAKRKTGIDLFEIPKGLENILGDTYSILAFQEQVMDLFQVLAGYTEGRADDIRKIIAKLYREKGDTAEKALNEHKEEFITKASVLIGQEAAELIWADIPSFSGYCLSGDTVVIRGGSGRYSSSPEITLRELSINWKAKSPIGNKLRSKGITLLSMDPDGRVRLGRARNVWSNGVKPVWEIITKSGKVIKGTGNHRFLTEHGYKMVVELEIGEYLVIAGKKEKSEKTGVQTLRAVGKTYDGCGVPEGDENPAWLDGRTNKFAEAKRLVGARSKLECEKCGKEGHQQHELEFAHIRSLDSFNGDYDQYHNENNILHLCNSCHKTLDYEKGERKKRWSVGIPTELDIIVSVEFVGMEEVFDVEMDSREHNFVANGIISHNSFNRAHASGYAVQAYQDAWLKTYYPLDFYAVVLTLDDKKIGRAMREGRHFSATISPPEINISNNGFTVDFSAHAIRYGLTGIRDVGDAAADQVIRLRPYTSVQNFMEANSIKYSKCTKKARDGLFESGALDSLGARADWSESRKAQAELERLGMALRPGATLGEHEELIISQIHMEDEFAELSEGSKAVIAGSVAEIRKTTVKRGKQKGQEMCFMKVQLGLDSWQCTCFPTIFAAYRALIDSGEPIMVVGRKDDRGAIVVSDLMSVAAYLTERATA